MKISIKPAACMTWFLCAVGAVAALLGFTALALASLCAALALVLAIVLLAEQRNHRRHGKQVSVIRELRRDFTRERTSREKSLGLIFRELQKLNREISGDGSAMHVRNERLLATNLKAMQAATDDVVAALANTKGPEEGGSR